MPGRPSVQQTSLLPVLRDACWPFVPCATQALMVLEGMLLGGADSYSRFSDELKEIKDGLLQQLNDRWVGLPGSHERHSGAIVSCFTPMSMMVLCLAI